MKALIASVAALGLHRDAGASPHRPPRPTKTIRPRPTTAKATTTVTTKVTPRQEHSKQARAKTHKAQFEMPWRAKTAQETGPVGQEDRLSVPHLRAARWPLQTPLLARRAEPFLSGQFFGLKLPAEGHMGRKILLVEDDRETAAYLAKGLTQEGHSVEQSTNGQDGLFRATDGSFDLDHSRPHASGARRHCPC